MSFWTLSDNSSAKTDETTFEATSGDGFAPIPDGTVLNAMIDEAKWQTVRDGAAQFISLRWTVVDHPKFKNRKIFQKLWAGEDRDPNATDRDKADKKRDKALRMLGVINANCGGKLPNGMPTSDDLTLYLTNKKMSIKLQVWEIGDASGNWISAVAAASNAISADPAPKKRAVVSDEEVPF
jgi:hypothetical protein